MLQKHNFFFLVNAHRSIKYKQIAKFALTYVHMSAWWLRLIERSFQTGNCTF